MVHLRLFCPAESSHAKWKTDSVQKALLSKLGLSVKLRTEHGFHLILESNVSTEDFERQHFDKLFWLLASNPFDNNLSRKSSLLENVKEIGPRLTFKTAYCTNALSALKAAGIEGVVRVEKTTRYELVETDVEDHVFLELAGDRMTEFVYPAEIDFIPSKGKEDFFEIDILGDGKSLDKANNELGLAFDASDLEYYKKLFTEKLKRNPTDVELFDLAQSDSEHSRHWFFRGKLIIDDQERNGSLMHSVRETQKYSNQNNLIAFCDNSSAIEGFRSVCRLLPQDPTRASRMVSTQQPSHIIYSAETHNFPTAVCPFQGAATGTGGRIRDIHATGKGAHEIAGVAGYSFGNLHLEGFEMPWEETETYPSGFSHPSQIAVEASNGASDYGNKFGEPVVCGFSRTFGQRLPDGQRCEYVKPIMFSGGLGSIDEGQIKKEPCREGMLLAKIGGPVYRIGVGGGAASSLSVQGSRESQLDFGAVQRGDAEMEQKLHRVVRACVEMGEENPILSIHDQGAGGNGNVLKELVEGGGAVIEAEAFELGDETISCRELWTAEYQENDACLVDPNRVDKMMAVMKREKCRVSVVGSVIKEQRVVLRDYGNKTGRNPVDFDTKLLGEREKKTFHLSTHPTLLKQLTLPTNLTVMAALELVLRLLSVASKRWLTCKVDRSVTGLVAQQQCVGPLHTPLADVAVVALSHFDTVGAAVAVGEQPIKGLVSPASGARMTVAETLTNLVFAPITDLKDVKMSGNWMWAAKCEGEGARLVKACDALCQALKETGTAIDGGKDSLSMAAKAGGELVKAPGTLVLSAYAPCSDVTKVVTPDFKGPQKGATSSLVLYVRMGGIGKNRLGGSALAQVFKQIGDEPADVENFSQLVRGFKIIQKLVKEDRILAGHDVSDGGWLTALLEMAFAGNIQLEVEVHAAHGSLLGFLFAEEAGVFLEIEEKNLTEVKSIFDHKEIHCEVAGKVKPIYGPDAVVTIVANGESIIKEKLTVLREIWEETGDRLGLQQTSAKALKQAKEARKSTRNIEYKATFAWSLEQQTVGKSGDSAPCVAIIREEGSNGDREMAAAFALAGFQTIDVTMTDMLEGHKLNEYTGVAFVGGFSYADVLGSAKGWAGTIKFNKAVADEFEKFRQRKDTFSFGVCNGCQLMALLGWVGEYENKPGVFLAENECGRFESSFGPVRIEKSKSIMLKGMDGSILGLWTSHGEGQFTYRSQAVKRRLDSAGCVAVRYVDGEGQPTGQYPWNPNGSEDAVAALCSEDGRHLALMPHSDRSFLSWQWPDYPRSWRQAGQKIPASPWIKMFQNAHAWVSHQSK